MSMSYIDTLRRTEQLAKEHEKEWEMQAWFRKQIEAGETLESIESKYTILPSERKLYDAAKAEIEKEGELLTAFGTGFETGTF